MADTNHITKEYLHEIFEYKDGNLYWKKRTNRRIVIGALVGCTKCKYVKISLLGKQFYLHRVIFFMHYGYFPDYIDHIDGNPQNNRIENLRECTKFENAHNMGITKRNKSGFKGVSWCKKENKWRAAISLNCKYLHIGKYKNIEDAVNAIQEARIKYHKQFARNK